MVNFGGPTHLWTSPADSVRKTTHIGLNNLRKLMPTLKIYVGGSWNGMFAFCEGFWTDEGAWYSAQAHGLPRDELGRPHREVDEGVVEQIVVQGVRRHVA